jgi:hypothetical protein
MTSEIINRGRITQEPKLYIGAYGYIFLEEIFYSYSFVITIYRYLCHYLTLF